MKTSDSLINMAPDLIAAQSELKNPAFDSKNPHLKNEYASLKSVRETITAVLAKHGIGYSQLLGNDGDRVSCTTLLLHKSGEYISGVFSTPAPKQDPQGYGSAATYARRYSLLAILGIVGDKDDDGDGAQPPGGNRSMGAHELADLLTSLQDAASVEELKKAYQAAQKAAVNDHSALKRLDEAKNARYRQLQAMNGAK